MHSLFSLPGRHGLAGLALALFAACAPVNEAPAYTLKTLHSFGSVVPDGSTPFGGVVVDSAGNLFGTTTTGTGQDGGVIFELTPRGNRWDYKIIYHFCTEGCTGGPTAGLIIDAKGNLYGVGEDIFKLSHKRHGWEYKSLYTFCTQPECADGRSAVAALSYAGAAAGLPYDGKSPLFGTTQYGGTAFNGGGVVFELTPGARSSWAYQVVYAFCQRDHCADGSSPEDSVLVAPSGDLFGVTTFGGTTNQLGTAFQLSPHGDGTWREQVLHTFCREKHCGNGDTPIAGLTMNAAGELFGTTIESNCIGEICPGVVFELTPQGRKSPYSALYSFCIQPDCADGQEPFSPLILDSSGDFFGSTQFGGGNDGDDFGDGGGTVSNCRARNSRSSTASVRCRNARTANIREVRWRRTPPAIYSGRPAPAATSETARSSNWSRRKNRAGCKSRSDCANRLAQDSHLTITTPVPPAPLAFVLLTQPKPPPPRTPGGSELIPLWPMPLFPPPTKYGALVAPVSATKSILAFKIRLVPVEVVANAPPAPGVEVPTPPCPAPAVTKVIPE